jgi:hypothetical protein
MIVISRADSENYMPIGFSAIHWPINSSICLGLLSTSSPAIGSILPRMMYFIFSSGGGSLTSSERRSVMVLQITSEPFNVFSLHEHQGLRRLGLGVSSRHP